MPFSAVRGFYDPSVHFELEFDVETPEAAGEEPAPETIPAKGPQPALPAGTGKRDKQPAAEAAAADDSEKAGADVVSLDAFRKK